MTRVTPGRSNNQHSALTYTLRQRQRQRQRHHLSTPPRCHKQRGHPTAERPSLCHHRHNMLTDLCAHPTQPPLGKQATWSVTPLSPQRGSDRFRQSLIVCTGDDILHFLERFSILSPLLFVVQPATLLLADLRHGAVEG